MSIRLRTKYDTSMKSPLCLVENNQSNGTRSRPRNNTDPSLATICPARQARPAMEIMTNQEKCNAETNGIGERGKADEEDD